MGLNGNDFTCKSHHIALNLQHTTSQTQKQKCMEKMKAITAMLTCSCLSVYAQPTIPPSWQEIPVSKPRQRNEGKDKTPNGTSCHKSPKSFCLPMVYYDIANRELHIGVSAPTSDTHYYIISNGEVLSTMCDTLSLDENSFYAIDISALSAGYYTLVIEIAGWEYEADLILE